MHPSAASKRNWTLSSLSNGFVTTDKNVSILSQQQDISFLETEYWPLQRENSENTHDGREKKNDLPQKKARESSKHRNAVLAR